MCLQNMRDTCRCFAAVLTAVNAPCRPTPYGGAALAHGYEQDFSPGALPLYPHQAAHLAAQQHAYAQAAAAQQLQQQQQLPAPAEQPPPEPVHWDPEDTWDGDAADAITSAPPSVAHAAPAPQQQQHWQEAAASAPAPTQPPPHAVYAGGASFGGGAAQAARAASLQEPALLLGDYDESFMYGAGGGLGPPPTLAAPLPNQAAPQGAGALGRRAASGPLPPPPQLPQPQQVARYDAAAAAQAAGLAAPPPDLAASAAYPAWAQPAQGAVEYAHASPPDLAAAAHPAWPQPAQGAVEYAQASPPDLAAAAHPAWAQLAQGAAEYTQVWPHHAIMCIGRKHTMRRLLQRRVARVCAARPDTMGACADPSPCGHLRQCALQRCIWRCPRCIRRRPRRVARCASTASGSLPSHHHALEKRALLVTAELFGALMVAPNEGRKELNGVIAPFPGCWGLNPNPKP